MTMRISRLVHECIAEFLGTWLLCFMGLATGAGAVTTDSQSGLWQIAVVWGFSVALAIYLGAHISGAHYNSAVTIALAISKQTKFPWRKVGPYLVAQLLGAACAGICVLILYGGAISRYEEINYITRGERNSTLTSMLFGIYYPNPQLVKKGLLQEGDVSVFTAVFGEAIGTMILMLMVRSLTDTKNTGRPSSDQAAFYIGFTVACLVSFVAPITQAGFNPARDLGPRLVAYFAGWGSMAIPGPKNGFWVYTIGPILGAVLGALLYDYIVSPAVVATTAPDPIDAKSRRMSIPASSPNHQSHRSHSNVDELLKKDMNRLSTLSCNHGEGVYQSLS